MALGPSGDTARRWPVSSYSMGRLASQDVAGAALANQPFVVYMLSVSWLAPPTDDHWRHADPILQILPRGVTLTLVPILGVALVLAWFLIAGPKRPTPHSLHVAIKQAALGVITAVVVVGALRVLAGATLPAFIPPEESAGPGLTLNMAAGLSEELLFRLVVLPGTFLLAARVVPAGRAATLAIVVTGLTFALLHQAGPGPTSTSWFVTRFLVPGCAMSLMALLLSPSFVVAAHCTAHVLIPAIFS
jgi:hypothetical protein